MASSEEAVAWIYYHNFFAFTLLLAINNYDKKKSDEKFFNYLARSDEKKRDDFTQYLKNGRTQSTSRQQK